MVQCVDVDCSNRTPTDTKRGISFYRFPVKSDGSSEFEGKTCQMSGNATPVRDILNPTVLTVSWPLRLMRQLQVIDKVLTL